MDLEGCFNADGTPVAVGSTVEAIYPGTLETVAFPTPKQAAAAALAAPKPAQPGVPTGQVVPLLKTDPPIYKAINLQKILVIYNADVAQSLADARDYIQRRKLNPDLLLGFHFNASFNHITVAQLMGTTGPRSAVPTGSPTCATAPYVGGFYLQTVAAFQDAHSIEAVILSTYTPCSVEDYLGNINYPTTHTLAAVTAQAWGAARNNPFGGLVNWAGYPGGWGFTENNHEFDLEVALTATDTTIRIDNSPGNAHADGYAILKFGPPPFTVKIDNELIRVNSLARDLSTTGVTLFQNLERGRGGTRPAAHAQGARVEPYDPTWMDLLDYPNATRWSTGYVDWTPSQTNIYNADRLLAHGRLGLPHPGDTIAELPLIGGGSVYQNAVTQALIAETRNHREDLHVVSYTNNYDPYMTPWMNGQMADWLKAQGFRTVEVSLWEEQGDYSWAPAVPGTYGFGSSTGIAVDPGLPPFFALCLGQEFNSAPSIGQDLLGKILPGAWGFTWTSSAMIFGQALLMNGGAAAICSAGEPRTSGLPLPMQLQLLAIKHQLPLMLALLLAGHSSPGTTVYGDPLYAPYLHTPLQDYAKAPRL